MTVMNDYWDQAMRTWRLVIPEPHDRTPVTATNGWNILFPLVPIFLMGYLVRRPNTYIYRLALMPFTIWTILRASFGYVWVDDLFSPYNFGQGLFGLASVGKAIEYGLVKKGRFKLGETTLGQVKTPAIDRETSQQPAAISLLGMSKFSTDSTHTSTDSLFQDVKPKLAKSPSGVALPVPNIVNGLRKPIKSPSGVTLAYKNTTPPELPSARDAVTGLKKTSSPLKGFADAIEVVGSCRGIGWDFGEGLYVAVQRRPLERKAFIKGTIQSLLFGFFLLDFIESFLKVIPGFSYPAGGSIYFMDAPPSLLRETALWPWIKEHYALSTFITKYSVSTFIAFIIGVAVIAGFTMCYEILTLVCVGLLGHNTESWPPLFDRPWLATSLADFWGRRWHQTLRQTFFIFGGYPLQYITYQITRPMIGQKKAKSLGRVGLVLGTFAASGLFHGLSIYAMGHGGVDHTATVYFTVQGVLLLVERAWRLATGKRVNGWWGRIWAYCVVVGGIQYCMNGWTSRGLAAGLIIPPFLSPTRLLIFPLLIRLMEH